MPDRFVREINRLASRLRRRRVDPVPVITQSSRVGELRQIRERQGLTLRECARRADIDPSQLSRVERGMGGLSTEALARLAHVLALTTLLDELDRLLGTHPPATPPHGGTPGRSTPPPRQSGAIRGR